MDRSKTINLLEVEPQKVWDIIVIGGGATGLGVAVDSSLRGLSTLLVEQADFTKGTSSRSTKLVHGGVRYLAQGDIALVLEALRERGLLLKNAPHIMSNMSFIIPTYSLWKTFFYAAGLKLYDLLAGNLSLGKSSIISKLNVIQDLPALKPVKLSNGILYHDGQFDDARLGINLAESCHENGGHPINYIKVTGISKQEDQTWIVAVIELETHKKYSIKSRSVVNATGVFVDDILAMDNKESEPIVTVSQGTHIVLDSKFFPGSKALMIPETTDGRVLFAIPWHGKVLVGTTDTVRENAVIEPVPLPHEVDFILNNLKDYFVQMPEKKDILSVFSGLRPLAKPSNNGKSSKEISRRHKLIVSSSGLITITGGKWTTYRQMAEETVDLAIKISHLPIKKCETENHKIHGYTLEKKIEAEFEIYGSDADKIKELILSDPEYSKKLHPQYNFNKGEVIWFVRNEMARTVEDVLARRYRILFLDARAAIEMAPKVALILRIELNKNLEWENNQIKDFLKLASGYLI